MVCSHDLHHPYYEPPLWYMIPQHILFRKLKSVPTWQCKTIGQSYGIVTAIGPCGNTMLRLRREILWSEIEGLSAIELQIQSHTSRSHKVAENEPGNMSQPQSFQSMRIKKSTQCLIEDPAWG